MGNGWTQSPTPPRGAVSGVARPSPLLNAAQAPYAGEEARRSAVVESPYPQRRPRAGSAGGRPEVESAAKRRRRHARACEEEKRRPKRKVALQPVPPAPPLRVPAAREFSLTSPIAIYSGNFGVPRRSAPLARGFGPSPGHAEFLAAIGLHRAVAALTRPAARPPSPVPRRPTRTATRSRPPTSGAMTTSGGSTAWCAPTSRSWSA